MHREEHAEWTASAELPRSPTCFWTKVCRHNALLPRLSVREAPHLPVHCSSRGTGERTNPHWCTRAPLAKHGRQGARGACPGAGRGSGGAEGGAARQHGPPLEGAGGRRCRWAPSVRGVCHTGCVPPHTPAAAAPRACLQGRTAPAAPEERMAQETTGALGRDEVLGGPGHASRLRVSIAVWQCEHHGGGRMQGWAALKMRGGAPHACLLCLQAPMVPTPRGAPSTAWSLERQASQAPPRTLLACLEMHTCCAPGLLQPRAPAWRRAPSPMWRAA